VPVEPRRNEAKTLVCDSLKGGGLVRPGAYYMFLLTEHVNPKGVGC